MKEPFGLDNTTSSLYSTFMERVRPILHGFAQNNVAMQALFRKWAAEDPETEAAHVFIDYAELPFLADLNRNLLEDCNDEVLFTQLESNLNLARELRQEIQAAATGAGPAPTSHLGPVFGLI